MTFPQRLKFYGIGFGIGLLLVIGMFGNRSCVSVNEQKMQELVFQHFELSEKAQCKLKCLKYNEALLKIELRNFEVNYDLSSVHAKPCGQYFVQPKQGFNYKFNFVVQDCDTVSKIFDISITDPSVKCNCD